MTWGRMVAFAVRFPASQRLKFALDLSIVV